MVPSLMTLKRFPHAWVAFCEGIHRSLTDSPEKGHWCVALLLMLSLLSAYTNCWTNSLFVDDLRCRDAHVLYLQFIFIKPLCKVHYCIASCDGRCLGARPLTHWGRVTHICVSKLTTIGSDNGLSPGRRQAIIWTNARILFIWHFWTNFSEISIEIYTFSFKKIHLKMSSAKWRPFCHGLDVF